MSKIHQKANELIVQNIGKKGDTKLLQRAKYICRAAKIRRQYITRKGHHLAEVMGSSGENYTVWAYTSGRVYCECKFFSNLDPFDRQSWGCKHILAHSIRLVAA